MAFNTQEHMSKGREYRETNRDKLLGQKPDVYRDKARADRKAHLAKLQENKRERDKAKIDEIILQCETDHNEALETAHEFFKANRDRILIIQPENDLKSRDERLYGLCEYSRIKRDKLRVAVYRRTRCDYANGRLDPNSSVGRGFITEMVVAKSLGLKRDANCNRAVNFGYKYDLLDSGRFEKINVKSSKLQEYKGQVNSRWQFGLRNKYKPDVYICVAYSEDRTNIEHVYIIPTFEAIVSDKTALGITNSDKGLRRVQEFEVSNVVFNYHLHNMSIDKCPVLRKPDTIVDQ